MTNELRVQRARRRLSQRDAAKALDMSYDRYMRIENDHTDPTDEEQVAMAEFFGVKVSALFVRAGRKAA